MTVPALRVSDCHQANKASLTIYQSHCGFFYLRAGQNILFAVRISNRKTHVPKTHVPISPPRPQSRRRFRRQFSPLPCRSPNNAV